MWDLIGIGGSLIMAGGAYYKNALTLVGSIIAFSIALLFYLSGGIPFLGALFVFFLPATLASKYKQGYKKELMEEVKAEKEARSTRQVVANAFGGIVFATLYLLTKDPLASFCFFVSFAGASADTWASEIGVLSSSKPVLIFSHRQVAPGISGGVTWLGTLASLVGSMWVAGVYTFFYGIKEPSVKVLVGATAIIAGGMLISVVDSMMGRWLQVKYKSPRTGNLSEDPTIGGLQNTYVSGLPWMTNGMVNLVSTTGVTILIFALLVNMR